MKRRILIILLAIIFLGSITTLALYNIGDFVFAAAIDNALGSTDSGLTDSDLSTKQKTAEQSENINTQKSGSDDNLANENDNSNAQVTEKDVAEIKDRIPAKDKIAVSEMVLSKLSSRDVKYLTGLLANGLTAKEKAAAKSLCYQRFSQADIAKIHAFYKQYYK